MDRAQMPSSVDERVSLFDRFAASAARTVSRAWFFTACVALVVVWAPSFWVFGDLNTWQLVINTATTIVTFLLVAVLQNSQRRADQALQHKLNALAEGLAELMLASLDTRDPAGPAAGRLREAVGELCAAVGLEDRESS